MLLKCGVQQKLRLMEQKALKAILRAKKGTSTDLIYNQLKQLDIILNTQYNFYNQLSKLNDDNDLIKSFVHLCNNMPIIDYCNPLVPDNKSN